MMRRMKGTMRAFMKSAIESLRRHQFFSLATGVLAANLLSLATMPILTRWYPVEAFGVFAVFWALSTLIGLFSTLRLEVAIPTIHTEEDAQTIARVALLCAVAVATTFLLVWSFTPLPQLLKIPFDPRFGLYVALCAIGNAILQIQNQIAIKLGHMRALSLRNLIEKLIAVGGSLLLAGLPMQGLILAQLCGVMNAALYLVAANRATGALNFLVLPSTAGRIVNAYRDYPLKHAPATAFNVLAGQLTPVLFSTLFSVQALGFYSLAQRLIDAPNAILNSALSVIYYKRVLTAPREDLRRLYWRMLRWLGLGMIAPLALVGLFASPLMVVVFGEAWEPSALYLALLLPLLYFRVLFTVGQTLLLALRRLSEDLWISVALFIATLGGILAANALFGTLEAAVAMTSAWTALAYLFGLFLIHRSLP